MLQSDELCKASVLVFANKQVRQLKQKMLRTFSIFDITQDVEGCMTAAEISKQLNLQSLRSHKWQIQSCCALTGEG